MPNKVKHHSGTAMTSVIRLLETALYVADLDRSCDFYKRVLGLGPDIGTTTEIENQKRFRPLQIPGGQVLLLFQRASPQPRRFSRRCDPATRRQWTASFGVRHLRQRTRRLERTLAIARRGEARWNGRAAGPASTFAIPTIT